MSTPIITVDGLGKAYRLGLKEEKYPTFRDALVGAAAGPWRRFRRLSDRRSSDEELFWALKDVSFEVNRGEVVGIIGRNGAGKSTLLKILSRIVEPTAGRAVLRGRVASLLEVGTGFHPELTGRENIYLNGSILGMKKREIDRKFDEIVAFAEVEKFLDTPVKRYSSGMYVRLAFAVAAHLEPEILIVDEVLAVGDAEFQKKCLGKMREVSRGGGRTVLFVSHNMSAIENLTDRSVLLSHGSVDFVGPSAAAIRRYSAATRQFDGDVTDMPRYASHLPERLRMTRLAFADERHATFAEDEDVDFTMEVESDSWSEPFRVSMTIFSADDTPVGSVFGPEKLTVPPGERRTFDVSLAIPRLAPGAYHIGIAIGVGNAETGQREFDVLMQILPFEIQGRVNGSASQVWPSNWGRIQFNSLCYAEAQQ